MDVTIFIDGAVRKKDIHDSRGQGKHSFIVYNEKNIEVAKHTYTEENITVPEAEMKALNDALSWACDYYFRTSRKGEININTDSELITKWWMIPQPHIKADNIKPLVMQAKASIAMLNAKDCKVSVGKINRNDNRAHQLTT